MRENSDARFAPVTQVFLERRRTCATEGDTYRFGPPLRQPHRNFNKINMSLIAMGILPPDWYTRVVHSDIGNDASLEASR